jgi:hypothetical protein
LGDEEWEGVSHVFCWCAGEGWGVL